MARYRELVLDIPSGREDALYERLLALAQRQLGPKVDVRAWCIGMLGQLVAGLEREYAQQDAKKNLVQLVDVAGRPKISVGPLTISGDPVLVE